jgi:hypothetical protein
MRKIANSILPLLIGLASSSSPKSTAGTVPLQITSEPADAVVNQGASIALTVQATGSPAPTYQWALNGDPIPGAVGPTIILQNMQPADSGSYSAFVQNEYQVVQSDPTAIIVNVPNLPFSDKVASRGVIRGSSGVGRGINLNATSELLEVWNLLSVKRSVWVSWTAPASGVATFSTAGSGFDTVVGSFQVIALPLLPPIMVPISMDDESGEYHTSEIKFNVEAGKEYAIGVGSSELNGGNIILSWNLIAGASIPLISIPPASQTVNYGQTASFSLSLQTLLPVLFQWFKNDLPILGATTSQLNLLNVGNADVGIYHCQLTLLGITLLSSDAELQINTEGLKAGARNKLSDAIIAGIKGKSTVSATSSRMRAFDISGSAGYSGTQVFQTAPGKDPGEPNHCGIVGGSSYWMSYTAPANGVLTLSTDGSNFDTVLAVYVDNGSNQGYSSLVSVACDNNSGADARDSKVVFNVAANKTYYIAIDGVNGVTGTVYLNYSLNSAPSIGSIGGISVSEDSAAVSRSFTISDKETAAASLQVTVYSSNPTLASVVLGGSAGNRTISVQPSLNKNGSATITVTVRDAGGLTASTSFSVTVNAVNDAPIANSDSGSCKKTATCSLYIPSLLANDSDPDGNVLSLYSFGSASNMGGKITRNGNYLYYTPSASVGSSDYFSYTVADGQGAYATSRIFITVTQ